MPKNCCHCYRCGYPPYYVDRLSKACYSPFKVKTVVEIVPEGNDRKNEGDNCYGNKDGCNDDEGVDLKAEKSLKKDQVYSYSTDIRCQVQLCAFFCSVSSF